MLKKSTFAFASLLLPSLLLGFPTYVVAATATHTRHKSHTVKHHPVSHAQHATAVSHTNTSAKPKKSHHHRHHHTNTVATHTVAMRNAAPNDDALQAVDSNHDSVSPQNALFASKSDLGIVSLAGRTVQNLRRTIYKFGGNDFDPSRGVYRLDCSAYVNNLLQASNPQAYATLAQWSRTYKPTSSNYYDFFNQLPSTHWRYWHKIDHVNQLDGGDILVFRYGSLKRRHHSGGGGHVMVVMNKPQIDPTAPNVFWVSVADSAASGHSDDTRPAHTSGVGIGKLLLKVNPYTKQIDAYAWRAGSNWKRNTQIVMASPEEKSSLS